MKSNRKRQFRRLISGLMASVMCLSLIPGAVFAKEAARVQGPTPSAAEPLRSDEWSIQISGQQAIAAGDSPVVPDLDVTVYDPSGREVNVPIHWHANGLDNLHVTDTGFSASRDLAPGNYRVVAYVGDNLDAPDAYAEHTIEVKPPRVLGSIITPDEWFLETRSQSLDLCELYLQYRDQYKGTSLDKAVNPNAAAYSSKYNYFEEQNTTYIDWICDDQDVFIADEGEYALFPPKNASYTLYAITTNLAGDVIKSTPMHVVASGFDILFPDVLPGAWYYNGVMYSAEHGFISGLPNGTFGPSVTMTRAQMVQMLYAFEGKPAVAVTKQFSDVKSSDWFAKAVSWAVEEGITSGVGGGTTFAPNSMITRQDMAVMLHAFCGKETAPYEFIFVDQDQIAPWALPAVQWVTCMNLMGSTSPDPAVEMFSPKATATRAEAAIIMMNLDQLDKWS